MILSYIFINHAWILLNIVSWKSKKLQNSFVNEVKRTGIHHITDGFFGDKNFMHDTGSHLPVGDIEQKMKLSIKDFTFSKCDHIRSFVWI